MVTVRIVTGIQWEVVEEAVGVGAWGKQAQAWLGSERGRVRVSNKAKVQG